MQTTTRRPRLNRQAFFADMGYRPHPGQLELHMSTAPRRVVACGVRWGKTLAAAMEGLAAAMEPGDRNIGWICAPTYDLADRVFREIQVHALEHLRHHIVAMKENERRLILRNMGGGISEIRAKSADNPVSLLGEGLDFVIVDEASRLKPTIWQSHLAQRLIDKKGWALLISTPRGKGYFFDLFRRGQLQEDSDWRSWNYPSWTNPMLDRELIEAERNRLPERVFEQEFGAKFVEGAGSVFRYVREAATGSWEAPEPDGTYYGGLDLAKVEDYTVFVIINKYCKVVFVDRFHRLDWQLQIQRISAAAQRYGCDDVYVDSTGAGEPIYEALRRAGVSAKAYPFTARSKAALIDNLAMLLERREVLLPRPELWPEGIDELEGFEFSVTDAGNVRTGAPGGMHDDCVVALALACWELRPRQQHRLYSTKIL